MFERMAGSIKTFTYNGSIVDSDITEVKPVLNDEEKQPTYLPNINQSVAGEDDFKTIANEALLDDS